MQSWGGAIARLTVMKTVEDALEVQTARAASRERREQQEEKKSGVREDRRRKQNERRSAGAAKKAEQAAQAKLQALARGEYPTPWPKLEVAKAPAEVKAAEAQQRAARVRDNLQWYKGAYQAATSARGRTEPRRKLAIAACARFEADRDIEMAERRKDHALQKKAEGARVVDAERKRAERAKRWREKAKTADRTKKWSRVAVAVQRELHRRQVDMYSVARVMKEGYWAVAVRRNDSDDEMYEPWRRSSTENDDEVYEVQDTHSAI